MDRAGARVPDPERGIGGAGREPLAVVRERDRDDAVAVPLEAESLLEIVGRRGARRRGRDRRRPCFAVGAKGGRGSDVEAVRHVDRRAPPGAALDLAERAIEEALRLGGGAVLLGGEPGVEQRLAENG